MDNVSLECSLKGEDRIGRCGRDRSDKRIWDTYRIVCRKSSVYREKGGWRSSLKVNITATVTKESIKSR